jgi:PIN domain nuclease of toxin-antitoxin system
VKVLLDTHAFLWAIGEDERLSLKAREIFIAGRNELLLSVASVWEILLKVQVGKIRFEEPAVGYLKRQIFKNNIHLLPILIDHVAHLESLPLHHRDPFDRILVAQSMEENLSLLSADPLMKRYSVPVIW